MAKLWGSKEYWGLGSHFDPDWFLDEEQKELQSKLINICKTKIRPKAAYYDHTYAFPKDALDALSEIGVLGLLIPKDLGGLGQNHVGCIMVMEALARYGCPSTAMVFAMHLGACAQLLYRHHGSVFLTEFLKRINKDKLIGTTCHSDPATGGHLWYQTSSKAKLEDGDRVKLMRYCSWVTSAGFADFYIIQGASPDYDGDYSRLSTFLVFKDEIRSSTDDWEALGLHGNQSGPVFVEGVFDSCRVIGSHGHGIEDNEDCVVLYFLLNTSGCWNGIAMAAMDVAKKHVTRKFHTDTGSKICDYPIIQDYFGRCITDTNVSRVMAFGVAKALDEATNNCEWSEAILKAEKRKPFGMWTWQTKIFSAKNVSKVTDKMLEACGGAAYKSNLEIERLLRDSKAGCLMAVSNEVLLSFLGKIALIGVESIDIWRVIVDEKPLNFELKKMKKEEKKSLAERLLREVEIEEKRQKMENAYQETDFDNPFNTKPPTCRNICSAGVSHDVAGFKLQSETVKEGGLRLCLTPMKQAYIDEDSVERFPSLHPLEWTNLALISSKEIGKNVALFKFGLKTPTSHLGCLPGQYVQVRVLSDGKTHERFFSPVSSPDLFGQIDIVLKYESHGIVSNHFGALKPGDTISFRGPCGGFEYEPNKLDELVLLTSGIGITPGLQLVRSILNNKHDKTRVSLLSSFEKAEDFLFREELNAYAESNIHFRMLVTLLEASDDWEGYEGVIDGKMIEEFVTQPDGRRLKIVICGGVTMVISCLYALRSLGYSSSCVFIYGCIGTDLVKSVFGKEIELSGHDCCFNV